MAWEAIASQAIDSGIMVGQNMANQTISKKQATKNFERSKELMDYQYSKDLEMWNRQNAYNSPQSQMARFNDAGLNPNLIYGQGSAGNATQLPKYQAPEYKVNRPMIDLGKPATGMLNQYQDWQIKELQMNNLKAQYENIEADTTNKILNQPILENRAGQGALDLMIDQMYKELSTKYKVADQRNIIDFTVQKVAGLKKQNLLLDNTLKFDLEKKRTELAKTQLDQRIMQTKLDTDKINLAYQQYLGTGGGRLAKESVPAIAGVGSQIIRTLANKFGWGKLSTVTKTGRYPSKTVLGYKK